MTVRMLAIMAAALMLAGCGSSPPTHFFTLTPVAPAGQAAPQPPFPVQVDAVHIPAVLDRTEMVRETGSNGLSIREQDSWGAPFGEMARNVLARDLVGRLPEGAVILPDAPAPPSAAHLVVNVAAFGGTSNGNVQLLASWTLLRGQPSQPVMSREVNLEHAAPADDAAAQAAAMSKLLGQFADQIAADLTKSPAPGSSAAAMISKRGPAR